MEKKVINPWTWQDKFGFVQANRITNAETILYCAGQVSMNDNGDLLHAGDMAKQIDQIFNNLETVLQEAGAQLSNVVRLTYYTTDIPAFVKAGGILAERLGKGRCRPATTLLGVASLFHPDCIVEIEATAVF